MKRLWIALPILSALLLAIVFIPRATPSSLDVARTRWAARPFTRYRMTVNYYGTTGTCAQNLSIEGDEVSEVHYSTNCDTPLPDIEYPTVTDILNYLQVRTDEYEANSVCTSAECRCDIPIGAVVTYDVLGYPLYSEIRPVFEANRRIGIFYTRSSCAFVDYEWSSIDIVSVTPE
jgi:hypothetical protein